MSHFPLKNVPLPIRIGFVLILTAFTLVAAFLYVNRSKPKALTDKDTILLTEFDNKTGDAIFDGALRQGLTVQLQQSPFLSLFPDTRVRDTLKLMGRTGDERVTREVGRAIAQRQGLKALIAGTIVSLGRNYSITLEALNSQTGEAVGRTQAEAEGKEEVLKALSQAAAQMREKLGEPLGSIRRFDRPLEFTTSSLEALKAFAAGNEQASRGKVFEAIRFYQQAVELAPDFAIARSVLAGFYAQTDQPELAAENARQAFALKDRLSDREQVGVSLAYYTFVTGELDKRLETLELYQRTYPHDTELKLALASTYVQIGQFTQAVATIRESLRLDANSPYAATAYLYLKDPLLRLNEFAEAKAISERALQQQPDALDTHASLYQIAFVNGDAATMQRQLDWARGKPDEHAALDWQTGAAAFAGQWRKAQDFSRRAMDLAAHSNVKAVAAQYSAEQALRAAAIGQPSQIKASAAQALKHEHNQVSLTRTALALALAGASQQTTALIEELSNRYPQDTLVNGIWLPTIRAALGLQRGNAQQAVELLEVAKRYEAAAEFWPQYVRGQAYLKLKQPNEATVEFQKILDQRGQSPLSVLYPLAKLSAARAAMLSGDTAKARQAYDEFFKLWREADSDLLVLVQAKQEYEKL